MSIWGTSSVSSLAYSSSSFSFSSFSSASLRRESNLLIILPNSTIWTLRAYDSYESSWSKSSDFARFSYVFLTSSWVDFNWFLRVLTIFFWWLRRFFKSGSVSFDFFFMSFNAVRYLSNSLSIFPNSTSLFLKIPLQFQRFLWLLANEPMITLELWTTSLRD